MLMIFLFLLAILAVICVPISGIWALNTLFCLGIAYTLETWFAALILFMLVGGSKLSRK